MLNVITDDKTFWKVVKTLFLEINKKRKNNLNRRKPSIQFRCSIDKKLNSYFVRIVNNAN